MAVGNFDGQPTSLKYELPRPHDVGKLFGNEGISP